jgi:hypothetical protein
VASIKRIVRIVLAVVATLLHLWYRAVLATPGVKRRKAARRTRK